MITKVKATTFIKTFRTGRTCPCLMLCEDDNGNQIETVVKLIAGGESTPTGLVCELLASLLARDLDIMVPIPFLVEIDVNFYEGIPDQPLAERFRNSKGLNFGSRYLGAGYTTWPQERNIPASLMQDAADIFAFDLIIQNPDRRKDKPNLLRKGDELFIIDHEMAFSFLYALTPNEYPWLGKGMNYVKEHIFYCGLKGRALSWDRLQGALEAIDDSRLESYINVIPSDWQNESYDPGEWIRKYLEQARDKSKTLFQKISEVLI